MKSLVLLLSVLLIPSLSVFASTNSDLDPSGTLPAKSTSFSLSVFSLKDEAYIEDIPFDTEKIYKRACCYYKQYGKYSADYTLREEEYIEDIPFNTRDIASTVIYGGMLTDPLQSTYSLREEPYIDDIPFNTEDIFADSVDRMEKESEEFTITSFNLKDEEYIDDIPWDTRQLFAEVIHYPDYARKCKMEGSVIVTFHYNEDGYIVVETTESKCDFLKDYIKETMEEMRLTKGVVSIGKEYTARFDFILK